MKKQTKRSVVVRFPSKNLRIRPAAKKGGVSQALVNSLIVKATKAQPTVAGPTVKVARLLARGRFRRADRFLKKAHVSALKPVLKVVIRGLRTTNPRYFQKHYAA